MSTLLFIISAISVIFGFFYMDSAKSVMHELSAVLIFILAANTFGFACVIEAIKTAAKKLEKQT